MNDVVTDLRNNRESWDQNDAKTYFSKNKCVREKNQTNQQTQVYIISSSVSVFGHMCGHTGDGIMIWLMFLPMPDLLD